MHSEWYPYYRFPGVFPLNNSMAIEKSISKPDKFTDTLKSIQFKEAGAPGKIETTVKKPPHSYLADLKILALELGFRFFNDSFGDILRFEKGNFSLVIYVNPILYEYVPGGDQNLSKTAHKSYIQWKLFQSDGMSPGICGLTPTELFFTIKG